MIGGLHPCVQPQLPRGIRLSGRRRVLCLCVQGHRAARLNVRRWRAGGGQHSCGTDAMSVPVSAVSVPENGNRGCCRDMACGQVENPTPRRRHTPPNRPNTQKICHSGCRLASNAGKNHSWPRFRAKNATGTRLHRRLCSKRSACSNANNACSEPRSVFRVHWNPADLACKTVDR
jgi:hypothetical protein